MTSSSFDHPWKKRAKWLTQALIISGTLNIGLLSTFAYFVLKEKQTSLAVELKPSGSPSSAPAHLINAEVLRTYANLPFSELLLKLENTDLVEEGYAKRDLALACLTAFHHFHLERALGGLILQKRQLAFNNTASGEQIGITLFPGLADSQYEAIIAFAKTEKWPFTPQGLFFEIKRLPVPRDPSLLETFYLTPEFPLLLTLLSRTGITLEKEKLVDLLAVGQWEQLQHFAKEQDFSVERRRAFLLEYFQQGSPLALQLLLEHDADFIATRFDDAQIFSLLGKITETAPASETFAKKLLSHPRSDEVWKKAAGLLYASAGEQMPEPYDNRLVLARFVPEALPAPKKEIIHPLIAQAKPGIKAAAVKPPKKHIVQEGESLWKIARKYHVSVNEIKRINRLESDRLRTGKQLEIPEK